MDRSRQIVGAQFPHYFIGHLNNIAIYFILMDKVGIINAKAPYSKMGGDEMALWILSEQ